MPEEMNLAALCVVPAVVRVTGRHYGRSTLRTFVHHVDRDGADEYRDHGRRRIDPLACETLLTLTDPMARLLGMAWRADQKHRAGDYSTNVFVGHSTVMAALASRQLVELDAHGLGAITDRGRAIASRLPASAVGAR